MTKYYSQSSKQTSESYGSTPSGAQENSLHYNSDSTNQHTASVESVHEHDKTPPVTASSRIQADDGFFFGIGLFETILAVDGKCRNLSFHLDRLAKSANALGLPEPELLSIQSQLKATARAFFEDEYESSKRVLKLTYTKENLLITTRAYTYTNADFERGFVLEKSPILRNESSPFTYVKSLNYGDNILEKRRAHKEGFDEPYFLNSKGELSEGATSNIFLIKKGQLFTPSVDCGLLPGTMRAYVLKELQGSTLSCKECHLTKEDLWEADEIFLTNALLGIMPVCQVDGHKKTDRTVTMKLKHLLSV